MAGRKPLPTVIKRLKGTLQKCRTNPYEPQPEADLTEPPDWMSDSQQALWHELIDTAPPGLLKKIDASIVTVWVTACDLFHKASTQLAKTGLLIKLPNTPVPIQSPYLAIVNKQAQILMKAAAEMGLTPATRSRVAVSSASEPAQTGWEDIAG